MKMLDQTSIFEAVRVEDNKLFEVQKKKDFYWLKHDKKTYMILYYKKDFSTYYCYKIDGLYYGCFFTPVLYECLADYHMKAEKPSGDVQLSLF